MSEIYIPKLGKFVTRDEAIEYFRKKRLEELKKNDYKYQKMVDQEKQLAQVISLLSDILDELKEISQLLKISKTSQKEVI